MKNGLVPTLFFLALGCVGASGGLMTFSKTEGSVTAALNAWQMCLTVYGTTNCQAITNDGSCTAAWNLVVAIRGVSVAACVDLFIACIAAAVSGCQQSQGAAGGPRPWVRRFGWWGAILAITHLGLVLSWWLNTWCDSTKSYQQNSVNPTVGGYLVAAGAILALIGACCESCMADPRPGNNGMMTHVVLGSSLNDPNVVVINNNNELRYQQQQPVPEQQYDYAQYGKYGRGAVDTNENTTEYRAY